LADTRDFSPLKRPDRNWGHPTLFLKWGSRALSLGVKQTERGANHSLAYRAQVKEVDDVWIYNFTPYAFMACRGTALEIIPGIMQERRK